jgi:hypothetical protein
MSIQCNPICGGQKYPSQFFNFTQKMRHKLRQSAVLPLKQQIKFEREPQYLAHDIQHNDTRYNDT